MLQKPQRSEDSLVGPFFVIGMFWSFEVKPKLNKCKKSIKRLNKVPDRDFKKELVRILKVFCAKDGFLFESSIKDSERSDGCFEALGDEIKKMKLFGKTLKS